MGFTIQCQNKGCQKLQAPYLDLSSNKAFCSECHGEIVVGDFMKRQMIQNKQFKKKEQKSFSVKCPSCSFEDRPKIVSDEIICSSCNKKMDHLTPAFVIMLKQNLAKAEQDI